MKSDVGMYHMGMALFMCFVTVCVLVLSAKLKSLLTNKPAPVSLEEECLSDPYYITIRHLVNKAYPRILATYENISENKRELLEGKIVMNWTIDEYGEAVDLSTVHSDINDKDFHYTIEKIIGRIVFPKTTKRRYISYTFNFINRDRYDAFKNRYFEVNRYNVQ